jgi:hypothetical protein
MKYNRTKKMKLGVLQCKMIRRMILDFLQKKVIEKGKLPVYGGDGCGARPAPGSSSGVLRPPRRACPGELVRNLGGQRWDVSSCDEATFIVGLLQVKSNFLLEL